MTFLSTNLRVLIYSRLPHIRHTHFLPDYLRPNNSVSHGVPQKRQLSSGLITGDIALPIVAEAINGAAKARAHIVSGTGYYEPSLLRPTFDRSGYYSLMPYPLDRRSVTPFRIPVSQSLLKSIPLFGKRNPSRLILRSIKLLWKYHISIACKTLRNVIHLCYIIPGRYDKIDNAQWNKNEGQ